VLCTCMQCFYAYKSKVCFKKEYLPFFFIFSKKPRVIVIFTVFNSLMNSQVHLLDRIDIRPHWRDFKHLSHAKTINTDCSQWNLSTNIIHFFKTYNHSILTFNLAKDHNYVKCIKYFLCGNLDLIECKLYEWTEVSDTGSDELLLPILTMSHTLCQFLSCYIPCVNS